MATFTTWTTSAEYNLYHGLHRTDNLCPHLSRLGYGYMSCRWASLPFPTTSHGEEKVPEADRSLHGVEGKKSPEKEHLRPSSFPFHALSFVTVTPAKWFGSLMRIMVMRDSSNMW